MFIVNQKIIIKNSKIVCKQNISTPGIYKILSIIPNIIYRIVLINFDKGNAKLSIWIRSLDNKLLLKKEILDENDLIFNNKDNKRIKLGILFTSPKMNDYFKIRDIKLLSDKDKINVITIENKIQYISKKSDISLVIPCIHIHFEYIISLLKLYESQTLVPEEVILVITNADKLESHEIDELKNKKFKFALKIIEINRLSYSGNTRYIGAKNVSKNIIIFQDADDIPHSQRLEMIKYFFDKYPGIVHVCHKWSKTPDTFNQKNYEIPNNCKKSIKKVKYVIPQFNMFSATRYRKLEHVANGNIGIRRKIVNNLNWYRRMSRKQDIALNVDIANKYRKTLFIREELYLYRSDNSSYKFNRQNS